MSTLAELARTVGETPDHPEWEGAKQKDKLGYLTHYERILAPIQNHEIRLLEIGVCGGGSLRMWAGWMSCATIDGVEIDPTMVYNEPPRIHTYLTDVKDFEPEYMYDVIIDDGSHRAEDAVIAFERLWPWLNVDGYYFIEDFAPTGAVPAPRDPFPPHVGYDPPDDSAFPPYEEPTWCLRLLRKTIDPVTYFRGSSTDPWPTQAPKGGR